jgi:hypothetical protein
MFMALDHKKKQHLLRHCLLYFVSLLLHYSEPQSYTFSSQMNTKWELLHLHALFLKRV